MAKKQSQAPIRVEGIEQAILRFRGHQVLLDADLARLYGVEISALNRAVKRNLARFPDDFMFQLTREEWAALRCQIGTLDVAAPAQPADGGSQIVTSGAGRGRHRKYLPYVFTEQGVAMLSSVLRSQRAVNVNIEIMRAFVRLRKLIAANADLAGRLDELQRRVGGHDEQFIQVIRAIRQLMEPPAPPPRRRIGFRAAEEPVAEAKPAKHDTNSRRRGRGGK